MFAAYSKLGKAKVSNYASQMWAGYQESHSWYLQLTNVGTLS